MKIWVLRHALILSAALVSGLYAGYLLASSRPPETSQMIDSGSWYSREQWPHDGNPYESDNFVVFSDAASPAARQAVADISEEILTDLTAEFEIAGDELFRYPPGQDKIHIYAYRNRYPQAWGARAYYAGFIIWSLDHRERSTDLDYYRPVVRHELVHVIEALLKGRDVRNMTVDTMVHVWFSEGLGEALRGGTQRGAVKDLACLEYLTGKYGRLNPISFIHDGMVGDWSKKETTRACSKYHYPMYRLAVEYLMDEAGFGRSPRDLVGIFTEMRDGSDFPTAFENCVGISLKVYEEQFFDRMDRYLDESVAFSWLNRFSIAWLTLSAGSLILLARGLFRGAAMSRRIKLTWVLVTVIFGPLGLLGYLLSYRWRGRMAPVLLSASVASMYSVTGNALGLLVVIAPFYLMTRPANAGPLIFLVPLIVGWLVFRTPLVASSLGCRHRAALRRTLPAELVSTALSLTGMLSVIMLSCEEWIFVGNPQSTVFWGVVSLGAIAGAMILYPYNIWMARRGSTAWQSPPA